jgi:DNA-directed RNA polymerase subunit M/transcription elongation factor TFIIS
MTAEVVEKNRERCPKCESFGVLPLRRHGFRKMMNLRNYYRCIDCGHRFLARRR